MDCNLFDVEGWHALFVGLLLLLTLELVMRVGCTVEEELDKENETWRKSYNNGQSRSVHDHKSRQTYITLILYKTYIIIKIKKICIVHTEDRCRGRSTLRDWNLGSIVYGIVFQLTHTQDQLHHVQLTTLVLS